MTKLPFRFVNEDRDIFYPGNTLEVVCNLLYSFESQTFDGYDRSRVYKDTNTHTKSEKLWGIAQLRLQVS